MIKGVHHISMKCGDSETYAKTKQFYSEILGLPVVREWENGMMVETGNCWLEIGNDGDVIEEKGAIRHFALYTDEVDDLIKRIEDAGYEVFMEPKDICIPCDPPVPARIAFCYGPMHEEIEFFFDQSENASRF